MALAANEIAVGKRILFDRNEYGVTRRAAAARMWLSYHQLNRIERGEVATPFLAGLLYCQFSDLNPLWLAFGEREHRFGFYIFQSHALHQDLNEHRDATFLQILERHAKHFGAVSTGRVRDHRANDSPESVRIFRSLYVEPPQISQQYDEKFPTVGQLLPIELSVGHETRNFGSWPLGVNVDDLLTNQLRFGKVGSMTLHKAALWPELRERILRLVRRRGMKSVLARDIGVSRQAITALLSRKGTHGPSAEYALRLSKWVAIVEAQQKQNAGSVSETRPARPRSKARRKSTNEKQPSSDRK